MILFLILPLPSLLVTVLVFVIGRLKERHRSLTCRVLKLDLRLETLEK